MFEHFTTPEEIFSYKLGSALTMEYDSLEMLGELETTAQRSELKTLFQEHAAETRQQIENLKKCFELLGEDVNDSPSPTTKGLAKEGKSSIAKTDDSLLDAVVLAGALETEHYETAVYETLITHADARGASEVVALLRANLDQEQAAIDKIKKAATSIAHAGVAVEETDSPDAATGFDGLGGIAPAGVPPFLPPSSI
ncbi:YciE/YciF ferroxidase family protein [Arthrobacter sp. ERGS1:01]|uniref:YciE/YciF ferroxidase family protein n=1 Tax=Arthrobacter sp. ERGS1:01 TaxID=1704044 RepID=UPI0006B5BD9C|nr:ferritin-like domain-containing protein [Arthrobacter sp. ERGS1:01]